MFSVFTEVMAQVKIIQLLLFSALRIHEVPPLQ